MSLGKLAFPYVTLLVCFCRAVARLLGKSGSICLGIKPWGDLHGLQRNRMGQILGITNLDRFFPGGGIL